MVNPRVSPIVIISARSKNVARYNPLRHSNGT